MTISSVLSGDSQLDDMKWGNMSISRFVSHQVWDEVLPPYLLLRTSSKGDTVGGRKHLAGIMHDRDPMQSAISMIGLYMSYQLFDLQDVCHSAPNGPVNFLCERLTHI